ncbi:CLUMA_CG020588, isoform A [Clunio marinus]|uniref:MICOS complex subunit MIC10 n=1 Tax=Clunio marinus TaxID=568069 RepID=A0A1J1J5F6_9DIPT|nr:CLUMA_CG020588, isoform A [Clunio marinus]
MAEKSFAEDRMGQKIDRCFSDTFIKAGVGFALGGVFSLLFFKRRAWPLYAGTFFGVGVAYNNCEKSLNSN